MFAKSTVYKSVLIIPDIPSANNFAAPPVAATGKTFAFG